MSTARHSFNPLTFTLTVSPAFLKNASRMDSEEFKIIQKLRTDYGMITIQEEKRTTHRAPSLKFSQIERHIKLCRNAQERLEQFEKIKALSQIQTSPYKYVVNWFLDNYANYAEKPEFDADGFVIVKTKDEMEAARKGQNTTAQSDAVREEQKDTEEFNRTELTEAV